MLQKEKDAEVARQCLKQIHPGNLDYQEWLAAGMAAKEAGLDFVEWDQWSARDNKRYKPHEIQAKWNSFKRDGVTVGTLVKLCRDQGGQIVHHDTGGTELDWEATIGGANEPRELTVVRQEWLQDQELPPEPNGDWNGISDLERYLRVVFNAEDRVGYVTESWQSNDRQNKRWLPKRGNWDRTAGEILQALTEAKDLGEVIGDWKEEAGAWIRFNPLDGGGCSDSNVTHYRHALVECDEISIEKQYAIYKELELPITALVHSAGKSLHAIVKIEAPDFKEYQKRVDFLYDVCKRNGLVIDRGNRNPSRLSRLPGATRNGKKQWLVATGIGKGSWGEWADWIAAVNDDLPDVENLADYFENPPPLAESLIDEVLRQGHKMLLAGPSKAGKTYLLLQLAAAIAEGTRWLGHQCTKGRVLYVNLEVDRSSAYHRLKWVYDALQIPPKNIKDIDVWNLRGKAMAMDHLAPKLIRRSLKGNYAAVIIDPIYKVITGDENAADQMAKFCNQFDKVCHELGAAVIYCHHHSKGEQGQKRAHDRASGSGVFARDPDALLDLIELQIDDARRTQIINRFEAEALAKALDISVPGWRDKCPQDTAEVSKKLAEWMEANGHGDMMRKVRPAIRKTAELATGWRIEGVLREYAAFPETKIFFTWPIHADDEHGLLIDARAEGEEIRRNPKEAGRDKAQRTIDDTRNAVDACRDERGICNIDNLIEYLALDKSTVYKRLKKAGLCVHYGAVETEKDGE